MLKKYVTAAFLSAAIAGGASAALAADTYQIDPAHGFVYFQINHDWSNVMGRFNKVAGTVVVDEGNPAASSVEVVIQTDSVDTDFEARDNHLRSPDFFNAEEFPSITFKSTGIEKTGDKTGVLTGDLTILGTTKSVSFPFTWNETSSPFWNADEIRTGFSAELKIMRSEWGMTKFIGSGIGDEVRLFLEIEAIKQ